MSSIPSNTTCLLLYTPGKSTGAASTLQFEYGVRGLLCYVGNFSSQPELSTTPRALGSKQPYNSE